MPDVILVDEHDNQIGTEEKLKAHLEGKLHRAFSSFIFNSEGKLLLQQRALSKYHSGGLWTNTCCSHPEPGEDIEHSVHRRLQEELGMDCPVQEIFTFTYKASLDKGVTEHEFLHVFLGHSDEDPTPNPEEVMDNKWVSPEELTQDLKTNPDTYTYWLKKVWEDVYKKFSIHKKNPAPK